MSVKISRILHAGYLFECEGTTLVFDPIFENPFSVNCYAYPAITFDLDIIQQQQWDAVFISHYHDDHFSLQSLNLLNRKTPVYMFSIFPELLDLLREMGFENVHAIKLGEETGIGPFRVLALEALDADVDSLFHIRVGNQDILHVVDSWIGPKTMRTLLQNPKWDLVLWPFQTMRELEVISPTLDPTIHDEARILPPEWLEQLQALEPRTVIPSSCQFRFEEWSWQNQVFFPISYQSFAQQVQKILPHTRIQRLDPGVSWLLSNSQIEPSERLAWVHPVGEQDVDYEFEPATPAPSLHEIAKHWPNLPPTNQNFVRHYCQEGLLRRFSTLDPLDDDAYFAQPRRWKLRVYAAAGQIFDYDYQVSANSIQSASSVTQSDWTTEICEYKLYQALEKGESLSSLYLRISAAQDEDLLEDPLLRCLYEGRIGSYQKAQFRKLFS